jgi:aryl-alcohol dehydrogenase-like predicted oxidoreductase
MAGLCAFETFGSLPRFTPAARKANRPVVDLLKTIGDEKGASPAQIALAWLLA